MFEHFLFFTCIHVLFNHNLLSITIQSNSYEIHALHNFTFYCFNNMKKHFLTAHKNYYVTAYYLFTEKAEYNYCQYLLYE
jgi:hypothetical protein